MLDFQSVVPNPPTLSRYVFSTAYLREVESFSNASRNRLAILTKEMGLRCKASKKYIATTDLKHHGPVAPNILDRQFSVATPDTVYVSDITHLKVGRKWHCLAVLIDLFSRMVVGWNLTDSLERFSAIKTLNKSIIRRSPSNGLIVHNDGGIQHASKDSKR